PDYAELEWRLRAEGQLTDRMRLLNIWDWMRVHGVRPKAGTHAHAEPLVPRDGDDVRMRDGVIVCRMRNSGTDDASTDRFRDDGSLLMTDRAHDGRRSVVFYDTSG